MGYCLKFSYFCELYWASVPNWAASKSLFSYAMELQIKSLGIVEQKTYPVNIDGTAK